MKIAVFSDVHGNLPALEAVLADITLRRVDGVYCLGDLVGYAAFPNEVVARIRAEQIATVSWATTMTVSASIARSVAAHIESSGNRSSAIVRLHGRRHTPHLSRKNSSEVSITNFD